MIIAEHARDCDGACFGGCLDEERKIRQPSEQGTWLNGVKARFCSIRPTVDMPDALGKLLKDDVPKLIAIAEAANDKA